MRRCTSCPCAGGRHGAALALAHAHGELGEPLDGRGDGAADDRGGERRGGAEDDADDEDGGREVGEQRGA